MPLRRRSPLRTVTVACHRALGVCAFRVGADERSRRHFERVLELAGDDFGAYVHLARIAYRLGDYSSWQRECGHARRTNPRRYAELRHPFELFESRTGGDAGDAMPWRRTFRVSHVGSGRESPGSEAGAPTAADDTRQGVQEPRRRRPAGDDFSTEIERERFRELEPLTIDDVRRTDLEELARQLGS